MCKEYQLYKMTQFNFLSKTHTSNDILELIDTNLCGPIGIDRNYG